MVVSNMAPSTQTAPVDKKYYEVARPHSLAERVAIRARDRMFRDFVQICRPTPSDRILDVGVSDVVTDAANMLERLYPHPSQITAAGIGLAMEFQAAFPEIRYQQIEANKPLPFPDRSFDIVTSNAVLEHVGSPGKQSEFLAELLRVGRRIFVTVPHRFFPVEHHTGVPILHWTDVTFALACGLLKKESWTRPENLILMSRERLAAAFPRRKRFEIRHSGIRLGPFSSNLMLYAEHDDALISLPQCTSGEAATRG